MVLLRRFLLMVQFLTAIPLRINLNVKTEDFGKGLVFAPLVGLIIGGILAGAYFVLNLVFPVYVTGIFVVVLYVLLTGGLHIDGLGDTFDGLFSNRPKERILEIMRDSRVGTNAVIAIVCVLLLDVGMISAMPARVVIVVLALMPVAGRIGSLVGAGASRYARDGEGLGKSFIDFCGVREIVVGLIISGGIFFVLAGKVGLIEVLLSTAMAFGLTWFFSRKIGGTTGDILGAVCELNQVLFLICAYVIQKIF